MNYYELLVSLTAETEKLRSLQKYYFQSRDKWDLIASKNQERKVDSMISSYKKIIEEQIQERKAYSE